MIKSALSRAADDLEVISKAVVVYEMVGQRAEALSWMEKGLNMGISIEEFKKDPELGELRKDERYKALVERLGNKQ